MANTTTLNMNNTNIRFMSSESAVASQRYRQIYNTPENAELAKKLDGYLFFDLYSHCLFLNGKQLSSQFFITKNAKGKVVGYKFAYNGEIFEVEYASIGKFNDDGVTIPASEVKGGLMGKGDKVAIEYLKDQIGFKIEEDDDTIKIIKTSPKFKPEMSWNDYQNN